MEPEPSERLVLQRVRNRLIEYFEVVSSFDRQQKYQLTVPSVSVPNEMINQWEDWFYVTHVDSYREPVFSPDEQRSLLAFHAAWSDVVDATPDPLPALTEIIASPEWERLRAAGSEALGVFTRRDKLPEDVEWEPSPG